MTMLLGQFYKTQEGAIERYRELRKGTHRKWCVVVLKQGYLLVSESALKEAGLMPRKVYGKKLSPSGILRKRRLAIK